MFVAIVAFLLASAQALNAEVAMEPQSGPPGTVITVTGIETCTPPAGASGEIVFERPEPGPDPTGPVTPGQSAYLTVPDVAEGRYAITTLCNGNPGGTTHRSVRSHGTELHRLSRVRPRPRAQRRPNLRGQGGALVGRHRLEVLDGLALRCARARRRHGHCGERYAARAHLLPNFYRETRCGGSGRARADEPNGTRPA